jgi:DNA polymerase I-like protein with 3'-5' exonuclease and polymerase domains
MANKARVPKVVTVDFETAGIEARPIYPPKPVGVSIMYPGKKPKYLAWGHPIENNCTKEQAMAELQDIWRGPTPLLFQNGKFDIDVAAVHMGCSVPSWDKIHDTMYALFLFDPHAPSLSLKPSSERLLGMPPEEQDAVFEWLADHDLVKRQRKKDGTTSYQKDAGAYISQAPGKLVGTYANGDTDRTLKLFNFLYPIIAERGMLGAYNRERQLMPIMLRNETEGIVTDLPKLEADVLRYRQQQLKTDIWIRKKLKCGDSINLDSGEDLADALEAAGMSSGFLTTATGKRSTSKESLIQAIADKKLFAVLQYRSKLSTLMGTFMEPWLRVASVTGGRIHTSWNQVRAPSGKGSVGTRTGRFSGTPNFGNIPNDLEEDDDFTHPAFAKLDSLPLARGYIVADKPNHVILDRDFSQQELRILAHFEDGQLCAAYNANPKLDIHAFVGDEVMRVAGREISRKHIKILNFLQVYGGGIDALVAKLKCTPDEARQIKGFHGAALPDVKKLDQTIKALGKAGDCIRTWGGRQYYAEEPKFINGRMQTFDYKLTNYLIQSSAADHTKQAIINYDSVRKSGRFMLSVHDQVLASVPKSAAKLEMKLLKEAMEGVKFDVPMLSDGEYGYNWGHLEPYKD